MDIKKLIEAARYCLKTGLCFNCKHDNNPECIANATCTATVSAKTIITLDDYCSNHTGCGGKVYIQEELNE